MNNQNPALRPLRYVRLNFDWQTYLETHYQVKYAGENELRVCCPKCADTKHKLYVNRDKRVFHCFKCDFTTKKGAYDVFDFVALTEGLSKGQSILRLIREYRPTTPTDLAQAVSESWDDKPEPVKKFKHAYLDSLPEPARPIRKGDALAKPFLEYLEARGLTEQEISTVVQAHYVHHNSYEIRGNNGKLKGDIGRRILWPLYGGDHKLVSWQARSLQKTDAVKYFNAPDTDISATLWPYSLPHKDSTVILAEGVLDTLALRRMSRKYSGYATFSKHISQDQIALLKSWGVTRLVIFWDLDAKRAVQEAVKELSLHFSVYVPNFESWPKNMDCGDCLLHPQGLEYLQAAVDNAVDTTTLDYLKWKIS